MADRRRSPELCVGLGPLGGGRERPLWLIANLTPVPREGYGVPLPKAGRWAERINTDAGIYGGTGIGNGGSVTAVDGEGGMPAAVLTLPPMASLILEYTGT